MKGAAQRWSQLTVEDKQVRFSFLYFYKNNYEKYFCRNLKIFIKKKNKNMLKN
jgi:hypothetical protein